jgi:1-acyl-sn-glycerol-3-phosphate acyltransferase
MSKKPRYPNALDQAFGARVAADQETLEARNPLSDISILGRHRVRTTRRPGAPVPYRVAKAALSLPLRFLYRVEVEGLDHLPESGPVIVAANHRSFMDSIFLALTSPRPIRFIAKAEYFDHRLTRPIFRGTGQIPLRRGSPSSARQALATACDVLAQGGVIGVYPEGTRSRDGKLHRGNLGPARLALASGATIVPAGLIGTHEVQSASDRLPRPFRTIAVRFGAPHRPRCDDEAASKVHLRHVTDQLMHAIAALSGQEYVDRAASPPAAAR